MNRLDWPQFWGGKASIFCGVNWVVSSIPWNLKMRWVHHSKWSPEPGHSFPKKSMVWVIRNHRPKWRMWQKKTQDVGTCWNMLEHVGTCWKNWGWTSEACSQPLTVPGLTFQRLQQRVPLARGNGQGLSLGQPIFVLARGHYVWCRKWCASPSQGSFLTGTQLLSSLLTASYGTAFQFFQANNIQRVRWGGYGWIWMDMDGYGWIWMDMDGYGWIWMDMDGLLCGPSARVSQYHFAFPPWSPWGPKWWGNASGSGGHPGLLAHAIHKNHQLTLW